MSVVVNINWLKKNPDHETKRHYNDHENYPKTAPIEAWGRRQTNQHNKQSVDPKTLLNERGGMIANSKIQSI